MPKGYSHLTQDKRLQIEVLLASEISKKKIAEIIDVDVSTIRREIKRNETKKGYKGLLANRRAKQRHAKANSHQQKLTSEDKKLICMRLQKGHSPEQIAGRLALDGILKISHVSIYRFIKKNIWLRSYLRRNGKKYRTNHSKSAGSHLIPGRIDISRRPIEVEKKSRIGDLEADLIIGKNHHGAIISLVDRHSKYTWLHKIESKHKDRVTNAIIDLINKMLYKPYTITFDNGGEFAGHAEISRKTGVQCFFATPYHSWERGLNEHTNGLVRQYLPKKTDFTHVTDEQVKQIQNLLNSRPRKVLNYKMPYEVLNQSDQLILNGALRC